MSTRLITVSDSAGTPIRAATYCQRITIGEDASVTNWPTVDWFVKKPTTSDGAERQPVGARYTFMPTAHRFIPGEIIGYVQVVSGQGSSTFFVDESGA